jgi:hypothetical protein
MVPQPKRRDWPQVEEIAAACGVKPRDVLAAAAQLGIVLQNRISRVDPISAERLREHFKSNSERV